CTLTTIDSANNVGRALDAIRHGQLFFIAYGDETAGALKIKRCLAVSFCVSDAGVTVDPAGAPTEVALVGPSGGYPTILYVRGGDLRSAKCTSATCGVVALGPVVYSGASYVAATVALDGLPFVAMLDAERSGMTFLKCFDYGCTGARVGGTFGTTTLDARPGATLGAHGHPVVSLRSNSSFGLEVCDNPECGPGRNR
ncbi:MAG TPA: hypothetical protein VFO79_05445, partial [Xanthomonadales bacterium]|nr:hypothetical protein [Xanthomonadales bacterium]